MTEHWREWLYPLGYIAQLIFGWRFLQQWLTSEIHQKSLVTRGFWRLSLLANLLLLIHSFIQLQFHVCVVQVCNGVIAWRNLELMDEVKQPVRLRAVLISMLLLNLLLAVAFVLEAYWWERAVEWFRIPTWDGGATKEVGGAWHLLGMVGMLLFSSRFWVQWWCAERAKVSYLGLPFWWLSFTGAILTIAYFTYIGDPVNIIGPSVGLIPYFRNLMLIYKERSNSSNAVKGE